jgi:hypothetical protein
MANELFPFFVPKAAEDSLRAFCEVQILRCKPYKTATMSSTSEDMPQRGKQFSPLRGEIKRGDDFERGSTTGFTLCLIRVANSLLPGMKANVFMMIELFISYRQ